MLNQTVLVGRIVSGPQINKTKNERKIATITLAVSRNYKNEKGTYDTDFIPCILWNSLAENTYEYCQPPYTESVGLVFTAKSRYTATKSHLVILNDFSISSV